MCSQNKLSFRQLRKGRLLHNLRSTGKLLIYGVWIDGKRINNAALDNYTNTDFGSLFVSKLEKNAKNYGKHYYQVNLMTNDYYAAYYKKAIVDRHKYYMNFRVNK